eukprot:15462764-Alexandrium_andersonii.AAC.1
MEGRPLLGLSQRLLQGPGLCQPMDTWASASGQPRFRELEAAQKQPSGGAMGAPTNTGAKRASRSFGLPEIAFDA